MPPVSRTTVPNILTAAAAALGIVSIITRPFLFAPIGMVLLMIAVRQSQDKRYTGMAAVVLSVGALAGAAIAAGYSKSLY